MWILNLMALRLIEMYAKCWSQGSGNSNLRIHLYNLGSVRISEAFSLHSEPFLKCHETRNMTSQLNGSATMQIIYYTNRGVFNKVIYWWSEQGMDNFLCTTVVLVSLYQYKHKSATNRPKLPNYIGRTSISSQINHFKYKI